MPPDPTARTLRALLVLGRVSNLPTIWSNCLVGWLLGGGSAWDRLVLLLLGGTFLYLGGMYLNDAFDADFDRQHRPERPIPSGAIRASSVWLAGAGWLLAGWLVLASLGKTTGWLAALLALCVVSYDAIHKIFAFSPLLIATCRFLLILLAASVGYEGLTGLSLWVALVLGCYITGLSYLARGESRQIALDYWPCMLLAAPAVLALIINTGEWLFQGFVFSALLIIWVLRCLRFTFWASQRNVGRSVAGLLAGIVLVDWLAVAGGGPLFGSVFLALFVLALLAQRFIPAT